MANPIISIIIPITGKNPLLKDCLASINQQKYPKSKIQTITIANSEVQIKRKTWSFASAVNLASKKAKGKFLLITNDDIIFKPNTLQAWINAAKKYSNTIFGANLSLKEKNSKAPAGYNMSLWTGIATPVYTGKSPTSCHWISGCSLFLTRKIFNKLNGFDENFSPGFFEDANLCLRAKKLGINCLLTPKAKAIHAQTTTFNRNKPKKYEYWYRNRLLFLRKHASPIQLATSLTLQYALFTPARALIKQDGRLLPALKGLSWNIKN